MREAEELERLRLAETPRALRRSAANRPNWISRVLSAFSSRLNFASRSRRSAQNRSASSRYSNPTTEVVSEPHDEHVPARVPASPLVGP